ncbi:NAD(P)/FAD-dependent oxidoreductase [Oricola thermophila]|uniref:FAD-dependent oxidoreductase n=1 Tax=Oricola thermophila TaxID=2742145 RepID=A0A6N1VC96_9HYPH|nr:FAD-dependent oxidoreductase [Oricola thermophila]QKV18163.1 FAD-dependent oxidoreductase [Oricola thermophila]
MDIVIIGGGYAGVACALRLARKAGRGNRITLVNDSDGFVERIRLHQVAAGSGTARRALRPVLERAGVGLVVGRAEAINSGARSVRVDGRSLPWDRLVLALGSVPRRTGDGAAVLAPGESEAIAARLKEMRDGARVAVIGGGLTGIEAATEIKEAYPGLDVALLTRSPLGQGWSPAARTHLLAAFDRLGVRVEEGVHCGGDAPVPGADLTLAAAGFEIPALGRDAGLAVNGHDRVLVDPLLRSVSDPRIHAVGDCAVPVHDPGHALPMGCKSALPMGAQAGDNIAAECRGRAGRAFDFRLAFYCVSLGRRDGLIQWADRAGRPVGPVWTGRLAAHYKEFICRFTWRVLALESRGVPTVMGMRTGHAPRVPEGQVQAGAN